MYKGIFLSLKKNSKNPTGKCDDHTNTPQMNPTKGTEDGDKSDKSAHVQFVHPAQASAERGFAH